MWDLCLFPLWLGALDVDTSLVVENQTGPDDDDDDDDDNDDDYDYYDDYDNDDDDCRYLSWHWWREERG